MKRSKKIQFHHFKHQVYVEYNEQEVSKLLCTKIRKLREETENSISLNMEIWLFTDARKSVNLNGKKEEASEFFKYFLEEITFKINKALTLKIPNSRM